MAGKVSGSSISHVPSHLWVNRIKRLVLGAPKRTDQQHHERLGVLTGLAVFSADAVSSVAYATEEILLVLATAGAAASAYSLSVGIAIVLLVFIVAASYNQTIHAYPQGGGSYIVTKDNLGMGFGLTAGASLLVDYVLTVAVSTASGVANITSAIPKLQGHEVLLCLIFIAFIALINLRGVRESGSVFAIPTYGFIFSMFLMIAVGVYKAIVLHDWHPPVPASVGFGFGAGGWQGLTNGVTMFMLLRAFASGCTALTGIEAVSDGVMAFKAPEADTAVKTMGWERTILYTMFTGITVLAYGFAKMPTGNETLLSQLAHEIFGSSIVYYLVQITTMAILLLAANTAYADFPRLSQFIARDGYLPRKLANRGDTLVFNGGIYVLAILSAILIVAFKGSTHHLIPLYAVGVFLAFTLSQTGMVLHWVKVAKKNNEPVRKHAWSMFINTSGAILSAVALVVITITKFAGGAWIVIIVIPLLILYFRYVHGYYERFKGKVEGLEKERMAIDVAQKMKVVVTIGGLSPVIDHSLKVARRIGDDITAVYVAVDPELGEKVKRKWDVRRHGGVEITVLESPFRTVVPPLRKFLDKLLEENPDTIINLLVPVVVTNDPFDAYLHNGTANQVMRELRYSEGVILTEIPFYVDMSAGADRVIAAYPNIGDD